MAQPATRQELIDYGKRQLGAPGLDINVAEEQIDDLVDDAIQLFHERHFDGTTQAFLKYKITRNETRCSTNVLLLKIYLIIQKIIYIVKRVEFIQYTSNV